MIAVYLAAFQGCLLFFVYCIIARFLALGCLNGIAYGDSWLYCFVCGLSRWLDICEENGCEDSHVIFLGCDIAAVRVMDLYVIMSACVT